MHTIRIKIPRKVYLTRLAFAFPVFLFLSIFLLSLVHEFGHVIAVWIKGGEVIEFMPFPFTFLNKRSRDAGYYWGYISHNAGHSVFVSSAGVLATAIVCILLFCSGYFFKSHPLWELFVYIQFIMFGVATFSYPFFDAFSESEKTDWAFIYQAIPSLRIIMPILSLIWLAWVLIFALNYRYAHKFEFDSQEVGIVVIRAKKFTDR